MAAGSIYVMHAWSFTALVCPLLIYSAKVSPRMGAGCGELSGTPVARQREGKSVVVSPIPAIALLLNCVSKLF